LILILVKGAPIAAGASAISSIPEWLWATSNLLAGNYDDFALTVASKGFDHAAGIPIAGVTTSALGAAENWNHIQANTTTHSYVYGPFSSPYDLPGEYPILGPHPYWYGPEHPGLFGGGH